MLDPKQVEIPDTHVCSIKGDLGVWDDLATAARLRDEMSIDVS